MITGLLCLIEIQKLSSYPILEYGLDSDPYESLPILLVEIIPGVLVTHIIYGEVVWVVDGWKSCGVILDESVVGVLHALSAIVFDKDSIKLHIFSIEECHQ